MPDDPGPCETPVEDDPGYNSIARGRKKTSTVHRIVMFGSSFGLGLCQKNFQIITRLRAYKWCESSNLQVSSKLQRIWEVNPIGSILLHNKTAKKDLVDDMRVLFGFMDGSWRKNSEGKVVAGIGGHIQDSEGNLLFILSGPSSAESILLCETEGLQKLLGVNLENYPQEQRDGAPLLSWILHEAQNTTRNHYTKNTIESLLPLLEEDIIWRPYAEMACPRPLDIDRVRDITPMFCINHVEYHMPHLCNKQFREFEIYDVDSVTWTHSQIKFRHRKAGLVQKFSILHNQQILEWGSRKLAERYMTLKEQQREGEHRGFNDSETENEDRDRERGNEDRDREERNEDRDDDRNEDREEEQDEEERENSYIYDGNEDREEEDEEDEEEEPSPPSPSSYWERRVDTSFFFSKKDVYVIAFCKSEEDQVGSNWFISRKTDVLIEGSKDAGFGINYTDLNNCEVGFDVIGRALHDLVLGNDMRKNFLKIAHHISEAETYTKLWSIDYSGFDSEEKKWYDQKLQSYGLENRNSLGDVLAISLMKNQEVRKERRAGVLSLYGTWSVSIDHIVKRTRRR
ncbi:hypothetical protein POM88_010294 [Heracleum sosnowskyi]|uniref:Uncharacterized protein n=1 Tax=Heracleum sosnowskyi TaxID=360622 RepID=A0AAD8IU47_9APIA|nr:hypothetical protein POM88_010294 [Heracleum sosnowskyi]